MWSSFSCVLRTVWCRVSKGCCHSWRNYGGLSVICCPEVWLLAWAFHAFQTDVVETWASLSLLQSSPISRRAHCILLCPLLGLLLKLLGDFILLASFRFTTKLDVLGVGCFQSWNSNLILICFVIKEEQMQNGQGRFCMILALHCTLHATWTLGICGQDLLETSPIWKLEITFFSSLFLSSSPTCMLCKKKKVSSISERERERERERDLWICLMQESMLMMNKKENRNLQQQEQNPERDRERKSNEQQ